MTKGFVLGKFMPLHKGHLALIEFAKKNCDWLYVILCYTDGEVINGNTRLQWLTEELKLEKNITVIPFSYSDEQLPNTSVSSKTVAQLWARELTKIVPGVQMVFSSEPYGDYLAEIIGIVHKKFDEHRKVVPVSATAIRENPLKYWSYIADAAKPWFVKKIVLLGAESTGKSELSKKLADHFNTVFVPEVARDIIEKTNNCTWENLEEIAKRHAMEIYQYTKRANKIIFIDTDITITKSYARFLFNRELTVSEPIESINKADLYFFLETDCPFVQDGTRIDQEQRESLSQSHKRELERNNISYKSLWGDWDNRLASAVAIVNQTFF